MQSEGQVLAEKLRAAGVPVAARNYTGVTHEFFGAGAVVAKGKEARAFVGERPRAAFGTGAGS